MPERASLIDKIRNNKLDILDVLKTSRSILEDFSYDLQDYYIDSPFCVLGRTFDDAIKKVLQSKENAFETFLDFCELVLTIIIPYKKNNEMHEKDAERVISILLNGLNASAWEPYYDEKKRQLLAEEKI